MPCVIDVIGLGIVSTSEGRCLLMFTTSLGEMPYLKMPLAGVVNKQICLIMLCTTTVAHSLALQGLNSCVGVSIHMPSYDSVCILNCSTICDIIHVTK